MNLTNPIFTDANKAREHLEKTRWPHGAICPHCGERSQVVLEDFASGPAITARYNHQAQTQAADAVAVLAAAESGDSIAIDLLPQMQALEIFREARRKTPKLALQTVLAEHLPKRLAQLLAEDIALPGPVGDFSDAKFRQAADLLHRWTLKPVSSEGYRTAEVTLGGVDTAGLDSATMQARAVPGLFVVGEVVDVTGWLGGYNFQWAWASGWAAGQVA